jgi:hypothetical protein
MNQAKIAQSRELKKRTNFIPKTLGFVTLTTYYLLHTAALSAQTQPIRIYQPAQGTTLSFTTFANKIVDISNSVIPFLIGTAVVFVIWGIFKYISSAGDTEKVAEGRKVVIWGTIALFLMLAFWGLVIVIHTSIFG